jgi:hypothetical protein
LRLTSSASAVASCRPHSAQLMAGTLLVVMPLLPRSSAGW